mmetsp:Transcript_16021/g.44298  ORF Transcript_16021/g.44298 Transcript_16021/m.44298 type:complete len:115 (+) Transcript_16021:1245-1589(+)
MHDGVLHVDEDAVLAVSEILLHATDSSWGTLVFIVTNIDVDCQYVHSFSFKASCCWSLGSRVANVGHSATFVAGHITFNVIPQAVSFELCKRKSDRFIVEEFQWGRGTTDVDVR